MNKLSTVQFYHQENIKNESRHNGTFDVEKTFEIFHLNLYFSPL